MDVSLLKQKLTKTNQKASRSELSQDVHRIATGIDNTLESLHRFIAELRPETVDKLGLRDAIEWQAREFQLRTGIPVEVRSDLETITMTDPNDATALFRIFQEVLTNVGRHAMASRVFATMQEDTEFFMMQIKDNGRGINETDRAGHRPCSFFLISRTEPNRNHFEIFASNSPVFSGSSMRVAISPWAMIPTMAPLSSITGIRLT
jgi:two-component system sensor histidine kinase UhpB